MSAAQQFVDKVAEHVSLEGARVREEFRAGLAETRNAVKVRGARLVPLYGQTGVVAGGSGRLVGWTVRETGGTAGAVLTIYSGRDATADVLGVVVLPAGGGQTLGLPGAGVFWEDGVSFAVTAPPGAGTPGTVAGSLYVGSVD